MKRHKHKVHEWPRPCVCADCPMRGVKFNGNRFIYRCTVDGAVVETPPTFCPHKPREGERVCLK